MSTPVLRKGIYLGSTVRERATPTMLLTLARYEPARQFAVHVHEDPGFFFLLSGQHREKRIGEFHDQDAITAIYHGTADAHSTEIGPEGMVGLNISYDRRWLDSSCVEASRLKLRPVSKCPGVGFAAIRLLAAAFSRNADDDEIESIGLELFAPLADAEERKPPRWLKVARSTLHDRYRQKLSLRDLAEDASVHPIYFARVFRRHFGCSVSEYIQQLRLTEAIKLIQAGASVGESATETGFSDHAHLSRVFRCRLNMCPTAMRIEK